MDLCGGEIPKQVDCLILGGGITGGGIARDAAMRGLSVLLVDSHDFASGTSHLTSKLIHGGLRYLEQGRFKLVMEGIVERDRLLNRIAPNLVWPKRFIIPFEKRQVPKWLLTVGGLQFYGLIEFIRGGRRSTYLTRRQLRRWYPLLRDTSFAASFWDAQTNDARLVLAVLHAAQANGAILRNYTRIAGANFNGDLWHIELAVPGGARAVVAARCIVNATGPWAPVTAEQFGAAPQRLMWIKGSHIIVRKPPRFGEDAIVIRSVLNHRPLWVVPWYNRLLIGSTESMYTGDLRDIRPQTEEVDDLFESFLAYFPETGLSRDDICRAFAGVRPIVSQADEPENKLSREHRVDIDHRRRMITVSGGKLTTFRHMAEETVDDVLHMLRLAPTPTDTHLRVRRDPLWPGLARHEWEAVQEQVVQILRRSMHGAHPRQQIDPTADVAEHLARVYGHAALDIVGEIERTPSLGQRICPDLPYTIAELIHLARSESVHHFVDLLKRRTPLHFLMDDTEWQRIRPILQTVAEHLGWGGERFASEMEQLADEHQADAAALSPREKAFAPRTLPVEAVYPPQSTLHVVDQEDARN
jgi:glycerol-3-phosphate dehydrogenase